MDNDTNDLRPLIRAALEAGDKSGGVMTQESYGRTGVVTIYTADAPGDYPIHGYIDTARYPTAWQADGTNCNGMHLIPRPAPKRRVKGWRIVWEGSGGVMLISPGYWHTREHALNNWDHTLAPPFACIEIDVEEGQGL